MPNQKNVSSIADFLGYVILPDRIGMDSQKVSTIGTEPLQRPSTISWDLLPGICKFLSEVHQGILLDSDPNYSTPS